MKGPPTAALVGVSLLFLLLHLVSVGSHPQFQQLIPNGKNVPGWPGIFLHWNAASIPVSLLTGLNLGVGHYDPQGGGPRNPFGRVLFLGLVISYHSSNNVHTKH